LTIQDSLRRVDHRVDIPGGGDVRVDLLMSRPFDN